MFATAIAAGQPPSKSSPAYPGRNKPPTTISRPNAPTPAHRYFHALGDNNTQASHRKYQCLGCFGFAGDNGSCSSPIADMVLIFTTRLCGIIHAPPSPPVKW